MPHVFLIRCNICRDSMEEKSESPHVNVGSILKKGWGRIQIKTRGGKEWGWICPKCLHDRICNKTKP